MKKTACDSCDSCVCLDHDGARCQSETTLHQYPARSLRPTLVGAFTKANHASRRSRDMNNGCPYARTPRKHQRSQAAFQRPTGTPSTPASNILPIHRLSASGQRCLCISRAPHNRAIAMEDLGGTVKPVATGTDGPDGPGGAGAPEPSDAAPAPPGMSRPIPGNALMSFRLPAPCGKPKSV